MLGSTGDHPSVNQSIGVPIVTGVVSVSVSLQARVTGSSVWELTLRVFTHSRGRSTRD